MWKPLNNTPHRKRGAERGVSLIELIIVIAITMVMVALTARSMSSGMATYRLSSSARSIAAVAQVAKIKATGRDTRYRILITPPRTFQMERYNRGTSKFEPDPGNEPELLPSGVNFVTTAVGTPPTGQSAGPDTEMIFNSRGLLVDSGGIPVNSRCFYLTGAVTYTVAVCSTLAGKTTVYRQSGSAWDVQ